VNQWQKDSPDFKDDITFEYKGRVVEDEKVTDIGLENTNPGMKLLHESGSEVITDNFRTAVVTSNHEKVYSLSLKDKVYSLTLKEAVSKWEQWSTYEAAFVEMKQMVDQGVFRGLRTDEVKKLDKKSILPGKMIFQEKFTPEGVFDVLKARFVAGGHKQIEFEETYSPTATIPSLFVVTALNAKRRYKYATFDVQGAYLFASRSALKSNVYLRLNSFIAETLTNVDSSWEDCVLSDGTMVVECLKALYGLKESGLLWYQEI